MRAAGWPSRARGRTWCGPSTPLPVPPWAVRCDSCPSRQGCTDFWDRSARARTGLSGARSRSQRQASGGTGSCARSAAAGLAPRSWTSIEGRYRGWPAPKDSDFRARSVKSYGLRSVSPQSAHRACVRLVGQARAAEGAASRGAAARVAASLDGFARDGGGRELSLTARSCAGGGRSPSSGPAVRRWSCTSQAAAEPRLARAGRAM